MTAPFGDEFRYRLLVEAITDYAIYMLDPNGLVASWNAGAHRFKGYAAEEIIGQHFSCFYTAEDRASDEPAKALEIASREGRFEKEGWRVRRDGARFWANVIIDAVRSQTGELLGYAKVTRDISDKRAAQLALEETRRELLQAQKMEAIGQLTGGVAHDFNNLLMAILGSLEMVQKRLPDTPGVSPLIENAIQAAKRGSSLTERMLAFARRQDLRPTAVHLSKLLDDVEPILQASVGPSVVIERSIPNNLDPVLTDPRQLETALMNLVVNARDAMPTGGVVAISGTLENVQFEDNLPLKPGRYIKIAVRDNGEGMDSATPEQALNPFFTTKGVGKGTGLGLPMVHGLAEQSGGRLVLRSLKDQGTSAEIWLPAAVGEAVEALPDPIPEPATQARPLNVIAVDDDALVLMNTVMLLEDLGHKVFEAHSADQALHILHEEHDIDLVITDHAMPRMTGSQLAEVLHSERPNLPVILATGYAELPPGADAALPRLSKPFSQDQLEQIVLRTLRTFATSH